METTADLTSESRTKLAQAKSKGLSCMLISEALNSDKSWDEIKDLLHLKLCNLDIHVSWKFNQRTRNLWQPTHTDLNGKPKGVASTTMQP